MELIDKILASYRSVTSYPDLVKNLINTGVESYTVDVSSGTILYRVDDGKIAVHPGGIAPRTIAENFDESKTIKAIRTNQQGKSDYPGFMNEIAEAGVRFYEATLNGDNKRVTYIGIGGMYEESIPL